MVPLRTTRALTSRTFPGPVLGAGQASLYSVKLNSSSPAVGDTLTATPYTAYNTPAASDTKVTYTWYESTNKYSGWTEDQGRNDLLSVGHRRFCWQVPQGQGKRWGK